MAGCGKPQPALFFRAPAVARSAMVARSTVEPESEEREVTRRCP